jgi:hypothetical protein
MTMRANMYGAVIMAICDCPSMTLKLAGWQSGGHVVSASLRPGRNPTTTTDRLDAVHDQQRD